MAILEKQRQIDRNACFSLFYPSVLINTHYFLNISAIFSLGSYSKKEVERRDAMYWRHRSYKLYDELFQVIKHRKGIDAYTLFVHHLKPALYVYPRDKGYYELKKQGFPFIQLRNNSRVFVQTEKQKASVEKKIRREDETRTPYYSDKLGVILGYPEVAVQDFINRSPRMPQDKRVFIKYHGITFVVHEDNIYKALKDIKNRIPIPPFFNSYVYAYKKIYQQVIPIPL